jgi:hypothetical protein
MGGLDPGYVLKMINEIKECSFDFVDHSFYFGAREDIWLFL